MRSALALVRASFLTAASYRLGMTMSVGMLLLQVVPTYYIGKTLQPFMAARIQNEGADYFSFLVVGTAAYLMVAAAVDALPRAVDSGISAGTVESLFGTPAPPAALTIGLAGYELLWALARASVVLGVGTLAGANVLWTRLPVAFVIIALIVAAYFATGMIAAALVLVFRRTGPLQTMVIVGSALLGGVSYPTTMVPDWLEGLTGWVPLAYGLRALRQVLIDGQSLDAVSGDVLVLAGFAVIGLVVGGLTLAAALRAARRAGTLSHY